MNRRIRRAVILCASLVLLAVAVEAGLFAYFILAGKRFEPERVDLVVVFDGDRDRVRRGFELGNDGIASAIMVSSAHAERLRGFEKAYGRRPALHYLIEDKARTTFENALYATRAIQTHEIDSLVLVTSSYHLPRSYLLLRLVLIGSPVRIKTCAVADLMSGSVDSGIWGRNMKMVFNEMVKLWGSLCEAAFYRLRGDVPDKSPKEMKSIRLLKRVLLFEV